MRKGTFILLLAVIASGLYIGLFERKQNTTDRKRAIARRVLRFDPAHITSLRVIQSDLQFSVEKRGDQWRLTSPVSALADAGEVSRIIELFDHLEQSDVIRGRDQRKQGLALSHFGLEQPRARITLTTPEKEWTLLVGSDTPVRGNLYIKEANDSSVFVAATNLLADLPTAINALRDHRLFQGMPSEATRLHIRRREGLLSLARTETGAWKMQQPWSGRAAIAGVQNLLDQLYTARIEDFVAESFDAASLYGLDEPAAQISVVGDRRHGEQTILLGKTVDRNTNSVYATLSGEGNVFTVNRALLDSLTVKADALRDRRLLTIGAPDINFIRIEAGERAILLARSESNTWDILEPVRYRADDVHIEAAIAEWTGARIEEFVDSATTNLANWGLAPPARRITFSRNTPSIPTNSLPTPAPDEETTILLSALPDEENLTLVKAAHEESLFRIQADIPQTLPASTISYRNLEILRLDPSSVRSLTLTRGEKEEAILRDSTNRFHAASTTNIMDEDAVQQTLTAVTALRALAFVTDDVSDLKPFGLAQPIAQLTVGAQAGATPPRTLLFGQEDADGNTYAMLRGGDAVVTLDRSTRDKLLTPLYKASQPAKDIPVAIQPTSSSEDAEAVRD